MTRASFARFIFQLYYGDTVKRGCKWVPVYSQDDIRITSMISEEITCYVFVDYEVIVIGDVIEMLKRSKRCVEILYIDSKR